MPDSLQGNVPDQEDLAAWWIWYKLNEASMEELEKISTIYAWLDTMEDTQHCYSILHQNCEGFRSKYAAPEAY